MVVVVLGLALCPAAVFDHVCQHNHPTMQAEVRAQGQVTVASKGDDGIHGVGAGSERVGRSEAVGDRLEEAKHINRSLAALGDVMAALAAKAPHVPFRNSKLTQLLQDSLAGQAKAMMFIHIAPEVCLRVYGHRGRICSGRGVHVSKPVCGTKPRFNCYMLLSAIRTRRLVSVLACCPAAMRSLLLSRSMKAGAARRVFLPLRAGVVVQREREHAGLRRAGGGDHARPGARQHRVRRRLRSAGGATQVW